MPSVTVRSVSINLSFVSRSGASSRKLIATCTIFVMACLSCPCFFESCRICSSSRFQSPASLQIVMIATSDRDVEARSEDCIQSQSKLVKDDVSDIELPVSLASPILISCRCPSGYLSGRNLVQEQHQRRCGADLRNLLRLWDDLVCFIGEVLLRLEDIPVRHVWLTYRGFGDGRGSNQGTGR